MANAFSPTKLLRRGRAWRMRFWGSLRVLVYCTFVSLCFTTFSLRAAYAEVRESAVSLGREMLQLADVLGPPQPILLNGTTMFVGARHVALPVKEVLDRFEAYCGDNAGGFEEEFAKLSAEQKGLLPESLLDARHFATMRAENDDEGMLACLVSPPGMTGFRGLIERAKAFLETGDLGRIGKLRYVFVKKNAKAGGSTTLSLWHEGSFNVWQMLFPEGDVPGRDTEGLPRPLGAVRVLSAEVPGAGYGLRVFETRQLPGEVLKHYEDSLSALGWTAQWFPSAPEAVKILEGHSRALVRESAVVFLSAESEGNHTIVTMAEMGTRGAVKVEAIAPMDNPLGGPIDTRQEESPRDHRPRSAEKGRSR